MLTTAYHLTPPAAPVRPVPFHTPPITSSLARIKLHFSRKGFTLPVSEGSDQHAPLSDREMMFLETMMRFLEATKKNVSECIKRLERTLVWRRTMGFENLEEIAKHVEEEWRTSTVFHLGFTPTGMPIIYFFPNRNTLPVEKRSVALSFFMLERAMDLMANGETQILVVFSFCGKRQGAMPAVSLVRDLIYQFSEYYPEVLGRAIIMDMPWWARAFVNVIWPFVDPKTKAKVKMISGAEAVRCGEISAAELLEECGGDLCLPYHHDTYNVVLLKTCYDRRTEQEKRWHSLGPPEVGREERLFKLTANTRVMNSP